MQERLLEMIKRSIAETVSDRKIGIAFSGGVDSTLMSKICSDMNYDIMLLTVGFPGSHDLEFAKKVNASLRLPHKTLEIDSSLFHEISNKIVRAIDTENLSWIENCIAFYYVSRLARSMKIDTVVTANGIDELFCGYDAYRDIFPEGNQRIMEAMDAKLQNEIRMMEAVDMISSEFGVKVVQPLLITGFVEYAKTIPISEKIHGQDDLLRKHIIRRLAGHVGVPEMSCIKRKKAFQYGSKIHKAFLKIR